VECALDQVAPAWVHSDAAPHGRDRLESLLDNGDNDGK